MTTITQSNVNLVLNHIGAVPCLVDLSKAESALKEKTGMDMESLGVYDLVTPDEIGEISVSPQGVIYVSTWNGGILYSELPDHVCIRGNPRRTSLLERLNNPCDKRTDRDSHSPYFHLR